MPVVTMPLDGLFVNNSIQSRVNGVNKAVVTDYTEAVKSGVKFPPLLAFHVTNREFIHAPGKPLLVGGSHRYQAYKKAGLIEAEVDVRTGTWEEAWLAGWLSNIEQQGERYTNADKRNAAEKALKFFKKDSAVAVAERIRVSDEFVRKIRKELVAIGVLQSENSVVGKDGISRPSTRKNSNKEQNPLPTVGSGLSPPSDNQQLVKAWVVQEPEVEPQVVRVIVREEPREDKVVYVHTAPCDMNEGGYYQHGIPARIGNDLGVSADEMDTAVSILLRATPEQRAEIMRRSNLAPVRTTETERGT